MNTTCIVFFGLISSAAGTLFWHWLLSGLPVWEAWTFSTLFSIMITGTLVASELYKKENDALIHDVIEGDHFVKQALIADAQEEAFLLLHAQYKTGINELAQDPIALKTVISDHTIKIYDELLLDGKGNLQRQISTARDRADFERKAEEDRSTAQLRIIEGDGITITPMSSQERVHAFMASNPRCQNKDLQQAFPDIPLPSLRVYAAQYRKIN
jgi:hypothetical protein